MGRRLADPEAFGELFGRAGEVRRETMARFQGAARHAHRRTALPGVPQTGGDAVHGHPERGVRQGIRLLPDPA